MGPPNLVGRTIPDDDTGDEYLILKKIGIASAANVYKAMHLPRNLPAEPHLANAINYVSVKVIPMEFERDCMVLEEEIIRSIFSSTLNAENILEIKKTFHSDKTFSCASMPYMSEGSLRYIMSRRLTNGLPEDCIAIALRETLNGLSFLHGLGHVHSKIDAGQIYVQWDSTGTAIKLSFEASIYEHGQEREMGSTSTLPLRDISIWGCAPEIYWGEEEYKPHCDIWLVGITALELAYGCFPVWDRVGFTAVMEEIIKKKKLPTMEEVKMIADEETRLLESKLKSMVGTGERQFSPEFEEVVVKCLSMNPEIRPTVDQLLRFEFFQRSKDMKFFQRVVVNGKKVMEEINN